VRRIVWTEPAVADPAGIRAYFSQFNPAAASRLAVRLKHSADSLGDYAERGRPLGAGRRELVAVWPYRISYRISDDVVQIIRIRHGAQRPE
jgi:toxin ParE1/3/4